MKYVQIFRSEIQVNQKGIFDPSPRRKWKTILKAIIFLHQLTGVDILNPNFKLRLLSFLPCVLTVDMVLSSSYTLWYYADDPLKGMLFLSTLGIFIPSIMAYSNVFDSSERDRLLSIIYFAGNNIYPDIEQMSNKKYVEICEQGVSELLSKSLKIVGIILTSTVVFPISQAYAFFVYHEIQLLIPVFFPFSDITSMRGLTVNMLNQLFVAILALTGIIGIELIYCTVKNSFYIMTKTTCYAIDEMTDQINKSHQKSSTHIGYYFRNILCQIQDFDRFILQMRHSYYWRIFLQPLLLCFSISISLFFCMDGIWISGLAMALFSYIQLFVQCDMGDDIKSDNEIFILKLHGMPWYLMSKKNQLDYAHLLRRLQDGVVYRMGPFAELNFETLSDMSKRMYTFLMLLLNMNH